MGIFRHVKIAMWQDPFFFGLCTHDKLFHNYLITNGKSTQCGIFEQSTKLMAIELGYDEKEVLAQIKNFVLWGKLYFDPLTNEFFLVSWLKHNFSASPSVIACMENELKSVKSALMIEFWTECIHSVSSLWGKEKEKKEEKEVKKEKKARALILSPKILPTTENKEGGTMEALSSQIIRYLNLKAGSCYRSDNYCVTELIMRKLKQGYSVEDFYTVIDKKTTEWLDTAMASNLRPYTLFDGHFDDYLGQVPKVPLFSADNRCSSFANTGFTKVS